MKKFFVIAVAGLMLALTSCSDSPKSLADKMAKCSKEYNEAFEKGDTTKMRKVLLKAISTDEKVRKMTKPEDMAKFSERSMQLAAEDPELFQTISAMGYAMRVFESNGNAIKDINDFYGLGQPTYKARIIYEDIDD